MMCETMLLLMAAINMSSCSCALCFLLLVLFYSWLLPRFVGVLELLRDGYMQGCQVLVGRADILLLQRHGAFVRQVRGKCVLLFFTAEYGGKKDVMQSSITEAAPHH